MFDDAQTARRLICTHEQFARQRRFAAETFFEYPSPANFLRLADLLRSDDCDKIHEYLGTVAVGSSS